MREIKFRAWDFSTNNFVSWEKLVIDSQCDFYDFSLFSNIDYILMQYTGLKDKSGVEIYEHDLIIATRNSLSQKKRVVKYDINRGAYFVVSNSLKETEWDDCLTKNQIKTFGYKVIGNIYENPELLNE